MNRRLYRSRTESVLGGVAGGVAEHLDLDPSIVRVVWALLALITGGVFFLIYIVMWIVVPLGPYGEAAPGGDPAAAGVTGEPGAPGSTASSAWNAGVPYRGRRHSGNGSWIFGLVFIGLGLYFLAREYVPQLNPDRLWPFGLVALGVLLLFVAIRRRPD